MSNNRFFISDLNRCKSFIRFWSESLHYFFSTKSKFHEIWKFFVFFEFATNSFLIICFHVKRLISNVEIALKNKTIKKTNKCEMIYIILKSEIIVESNLISFATTTINKIIIETCNMFDVHKSTIDFENRHFQTSFADDIIALWHFQEICFRKSPRKWRWGKKYEKKKSENLKMFYILKIIFELKLIRFATMTINNKMIIETMTTCSIDKWIK